MNKAQKVVSQHQYVDPVLAFLAATTHLAKALALPRRSPSCCWYVQPDECGWSGWVRCWCDDKWLPWQGSVDFVFSQGFSLHSMVS